MYIDTECTHYVRSGSEVAASIHWWCHQTTFPADLITASVYFTTRNTHAHLCLAPVHRLGSKLQYMMM